MSAQSAKKKRLGSRRRVENQNETSKTDDSHVTGSTFVAQRHIPEENTESLDVLADFHNSQSETQHSAELLGNRRKLGSSRRNKEQHVKESVTESYHDPREEVEHITRGLAIQAERQADTSPDYYSDVRNATTNCSEADLESFSSKSKNLQADREENETASEVITESCKLVKTMQEGIDKSDLHSEEVKESAHLIGISELTSLSVLTCPTGGQQLIDRSNCREMPEEQLPDVCSVTEDDGKERELFFSTTSNIHNCPTNQAISIPDQQDELPTKENVEAFEQKNEDYHVYDTKKPQISDIERVDTALGQVFEIEGRVESDTKPSAEQTGHQEQEGLLSEMEESASSLQTLQSEINVAFDSEPQQNDISFNPIGNRRKLGSSHRNKGRRHVKDSVAETEHQPTKDVVGNISDNETLETTEMTLTIETPVQEKSMETLLEGTDKFDTAPTEDDSDQVKENAQDGTLVSIANLNSLGLQSRSTVDQQTIEQSTFRQMSDEEVPNVCSVTENKERDEDTDWFRQDVNSQGKYLVSQDIEFSITPEITPEIHSSRQHTEPECNVEQEIFSSPKEELHANEGQNKIFNLPKVKGDYHSEINVNTLHEQDVEPTENQEMPQHDYSSGNVIHDATKSSEFISGNLMNQTQVSDTYQSELTVENADDSPTNQDNSNPNNIHDEHPTEENPFEASEQKSNSFYVYESKELQISDIERTDTALGQVFEIEGRVESDTKPSAEQTGHQEQEGLLSEMEESASSLQTLQSEINIAFDSERQQNDISFNPIGNRRKLGSSRRNKGRRHVKDSVAESEHQPTEDVVGNISDNETLETTEMTLTIETPVQEKSMETLLEGTDKFDTAPTEDDSDQVKENAQDGTLVGIANLNSLGLQSRSTVDQQTIEQSTFRQMSGEEVPNVCSVTEKENKERDEDTDWFRQDGNLQGKYLVSQNIEFSITPEITPEKHSSRQHTEPECNVEQEIFSSPKEELHANEGQNKIFNLPEVKGDYHSEVNVNTLHEQDVEPTENQEMPQLDYSSGNVIHDATESSEFISGNLMNQTQVSDTYQSELTVENADDSPTNQDNSNPNNIHDEHPTEENHFEASEQKNNVFYVYESKELQISDIERADTALGQVFEIEGRVESDTKPSAEQTGHQEQERLLSQMEDSASSLQTLQSEINIAFDSEPQQNDISFNPIGNRKKLGSSRRNKGRRHVKDSVAESDNRHKEDGESTRPNEAFETVQMSLPIERTSHEELSQYDIMPATHDSSLYAAITPGYSSEVWSPTQKHYPEAVLESLIPKSENLQEDHDERANDFKVEVSDKSVEATMEGADKSDALQNEGVRGDHRTGDAVNKPHVQDVEPTENQEMPQLDDSSESVIHDATENSGNPKDQTEVSDTYQSELTVENTNDSLTNQDNSNPDNIRDEHPTEETPFEASEQKNNGFHVYESQEIQISDIERADTALGQVLEIEGRVEGDTKPSAEQTGHQEQEGLLSEMEESASSLQTLQSEINIAFDSEPQQNDISFNPIGNRRKLGSSRRNKGRRHVKDSVAESEHQPTEDVVGNISDNETFETTEMTLTIETPVQEKSMETLLEGTDKFDTAPTEDDSDQVKENAQDGTLVGIANLNSLGLQSSSTVDQQTIEQSTFRQMSDEEVPNVCSVTEKENKERDEDTDWFRQDGNLQGKYLVSQDIEFSITPEITPEKHSSRQHTEPECNVEQAIFSSPKEELHANEGQNKIFNLPEVKGDYHSEVNVNTLHEQDVEPTENQEMPQLDYSSGNVIHDATESSEFISGNLMNQTEVSDTYQSELTVENADDSPTNQDNSNPNNIHDEHPTEENPFEASEQKNNSLYVYESKELQISDIERTDTALGQVFEIEGRVESDTKPSAEQTGHQEQEGLLSEMEESASSLQTLQSEINIAFDSEPQQNDISFNPIGNRRKLGSSRRNKGRRHVKDSVAESEHQPTEDVVGNISDNETLETTEMTLTIETPVQEKSMETLLEGTDKFDTAPTEDDSDQVKENAQDGTLVGIANLNSLGLQSRSTVDQQTIEQSTFRQMSGEEVPNVCSVTEKENKERDEDTDWFRQDGNLQGKYLVSQNIEFSITPEITPEKHSSRQHTEPECNVEQEIFSSPKEELHANEGQNKIFNLPEVKGDYHSEVNVNTLHEQDVEPTENQEMPQLDYSSGNVIHDATESSEFISGNLMNQTQVSDTYQSELTVENADDSPTNQDNSNPNNIHDEHPTEENHFEASEQKNNVFYVYESKELQISDIERADTALGQVFEIEGRVESDTKPSAEQTGHQEQERLLSQMEDSASSLQTLQSEINIAFDSEPQQNDISFNPIGNRKKLGSSRRNKGRRHVKDSVAESDNRHKEDGESTRPNEAFETVQMSLPIERTSHEELSQYDIMPATHDSSLYAAITPGYSSEVWSPTQKHYPEAVLESLIPKSENLQEDHDERANDFKVEVSDKSVEATMEGADKSDALQNEGVRGDHRTGDAVNKPHVQDVEPTENQEMPQLDDSSESVIHDATENSGNPKDQTEVSDTYQSELTVENTNDSLTNQDNSNPDNIRDEHPTEETPFEASEQKNNGFHVYESQEIQISDIERADTALGQVLEIEGRVEGDTKPSAEQTGHQEQEGLLSEMEESASSLQTLQSEINIAFDSEPQQNDISFNPIGNRRKLGSSRRNKGRRHVKDSVAESEHQPTEDVVGNISDNETFETTEMTLTIETPVQEKSMETLLEGTDKFDTAPTEDDSDQVKENAQDGTLVGIANLNSLGLQSSSTVDQQTIEQSTFRQMSDEEVPNVCSVTEKENKERDEDTDWFRQDGNLQGKYLVSQDIEFSITPEITPEKHSSRQHTEPECNVEQAIFSSPKEELHANEGQNKIFNLPEVKGDYHSEVNVNTLHEQDVEPTENQEMPQLDYSSGNVIHDATESSEFISGNLMNQTEVSDTYQSELTVENADDSPTNQDNSNPNNIHDEHPTEENPFEASEQKNNSLYVYESKELQISDIERTDTALGQVFEIEGRVESDTKPSAEQTGHQEQEGLLSEMEESASSLQTLQSEINIAFDSEPQQNDISFNPIGNRRKLGSSRRNKGRRHVKDSVAESEHQPTEDVVGNISDNETLETTEMTLTIETPVQEKSMETLLEGTDKFDTAPTEDDSDQVKENAQDGTLVGIANLNSLGLQSRSTVDQQTIEQSTFRQMSGEEVPNVCSVTEKENKERDEDTDWFRQDGNLQGKYLVSQNIEFSITPEITPEKHSSRQHTEPECNVEQEIFSSPKEELHANERQNKIFNLPEVKGDYHSEVNVNTLHEQDVEPTENQEMPQLDYSSGNVIHDATESSEFISGNLMNQTQVSDTYQSELTVENADDSPTNQDNSNPNNIHDEHPTEENHFEASEQKNNVFYVYESKELQISDIERADTALGQVFEIEGRVESDTKPSAEQTGHQEQERLLSQMEESASSLQTLQSEINIAFDSEPQQNDISFNPIGNRKKLGSSRRNKGRRHVKDSVAESDNRHKEDGESTRPNEAFETVQMSLPIERTSHEELSQYDIMPATHDSSLYAAITPGYSSEVWSPTQKHYPEAVLESLIPKSENLQEDHDERANDFKVEVSDKSVEATMEGADKSDALQNEGVRGDHRTGDAVNKPHVQDVEPTENQEMPQLDDSSESVIHDATENSGNPKDQTEVSDTYQSELTVENTNDSLTNQDNSNPDNIRDEHPTEETPFEASEQKNNGFHVYESQEIQISDIERADTALGQVLEIEGRVEGDTKPSAEQTGHQEQEGLLSEMEESASSLQTLQSEINIAFDSEPQQNDISFNPIGNRRKLGSSRRNKGRRHVKDSVAESEHQPTEDVVGNISDNETFETTEMTLTIETPVQEKSMETLLEGTDKFDTAPTEDDSDQVKENAQDGTLVGIANLNSLGLQSSSTVDQQTIEQSTFRQMSDEEVPNVCSVTEKENKERDEDTDWFRQDGNLQGKYLVSQDIEFSITPEITPEKHSSRQHTEPECNVEQAIFSSPKEELHANEGQNKIFNLPEVKGDYHSEVNVNTLHEQDVEPTENQEMPQLDYSSGNVIHDATESSEFISGNLMNQTEVSDTYQSELTVENADDSPTNQDNSNPNNIHDEHPTEENPFEASEQKNNSLYVYESKELQISDIERTDTALGQVFEIEGRVESDTKPSAEQTGHQEQEGLLSEMEESASSLQTLQSEINIAFDSERQQNDISFNPIGNRRKLGSSRRNKGRRHVKDSVAESEHQPTEDVVGNISDNETLETTEMTLTIETPVQEKSMETLLEGTDKFDTAPTEDDSDQVKENAQDGTLVGIANLNSLGLQSRSTVDQQTIEQSTFRQMSGEEVPNVCSVTEKENKERDEDTDWFRQDGNLQGKYLVSQNIEFSITPEITPEKHSSRQHTEPECNVEQEIFSSPKEELHANEGQNKIFNLPEVKGDYHSEVNVNTLHEQDVEPTENQEMPQLDYSSGNVIHDATESSEFISGNLMNQTQVSDTYQSELTVENADDSPTNQDNSNPNNIHDEHPTEENHFEASEQKNNVFYVYESKELQISDIERADTALGQVLEIEGRVEGDTKPSAEQTGHQEQEGLLSEMEESASSLQTLQSEINIAFDSEPQQNDISFNPIGNRRKLGSSRRNKGRRHVKDSVAESEHQPTEDVVGNISDNETLETTEMTLTIETPVQEKSMETLLEGTDKFDTAPTEDDSDQVKENAQDGTLVGIANLNSLGLQSSSTVDQQTVEQSTFRQMSDEEVPNVCSVTEKENKERDEDTDWFRQDGNLQGKYLVSQDIEFSITPEITPEKHSSRQHTEPECNVEQEIFSSPKEELHANEGQNKIFNLPKVKGDYHSEVNVKKLHEQDVEPTENQEMPQLNYSSGNVPIGNRRKLGSSRRNKGRRHVKDSVAESEHQPTEDVVGNISDNETLETTEMTLTIETPVQEKTMETLLEGTDKFDTAPTEDDSDQVKENAQDGTLVGIANLNSSGLQSRSTVDQQTIEQSTFRQMSDEEVPNVCSVTEKDTEKSSPKERNEIECSVGQAEEKLSINEEQKEHVNLSQVRGTWHSPDAVNKVHEEEIKPTQMQEMHETDNLSIKDSESNLQKLQSEISAPLDAQPLDNSQNIKEQTHKGFNPTGNRRKLGSSQRNGRLHVKDATKMSLVMETMRQEEIKERTDLDSKSAGEMRKNRSTVNDKENTEKMSEDDTILSQNLMGNNTIVTTAITSSSGKDDSNKKVIEEENHLIKETENLGQLTGCDTVKMDLIQSPEVLVWKDDSDLQSISYQDDVTARSNTSDEAFQVQIAEASYFDKETIMQQTNDTSETVGDVPIKDCKTGTESTMYVQVYGEDEDGEQFEDLTKKEHKAEEINVSKEMISAPHNKTDTLATFDIGLKDENLRAEPAVDVSEESGISSQQGIQDKTNLDDSENLQGRSKQKRRKMGSTRRTQLNRKPEEKRVETKESDREADVRNLDKMEVAEELTMIATTEVTQNENAKLSLSLVYQEQMETNETSTVDGKGQTLQSFDLQSNMTSGIDYSKALPPEQSGSHNEEVVDPVKFVHVADVSDSKRNVDVSVEPSQIDDFSATEMHITSAFAGRNTINPLLSASTKDTTNTGISGGGFVVLCETAQSTQNDEARPENVNIIQDQALKSTDALVLGDLEIVKSVVKGGAGEEHITAGASKQEPDNANEGDHNKNLEMKNASSHLDTTSRRRKMGSTRRNLRTGTKQEDLHQKQDVNDEATEAATNVVDVKTESFSSIIKDELQLDVTHKDSGSETIEYSNTGESQKPLAHQTFEKNPVSQGQLLETEDQITPSDLPAMPSTSPKHDLISESASGGRRRKMGSHRKSHGHQNYENQTAGRDRITDTQNERDVRSIGEESAIKTEELREECLGLDKISKVDKSHKKPLSNLSTSKEREHSRPVSEKTPESVTPVQHRYAEIQSHESQQKFSLAHRADLRSNAYNVMMVGDSNVGKTSFMKRAQSGKFSLDTPPSIGLDSCMWNVIVEGKPMALQLWDTAGQERFHSITRQIFHKAHAFLLMYDITSSQSFSAVSYWASCIQEGAAESVNILLVGNKSDQAERQVKTQEAENLAKEYNFEFMECSAATGENVVQSLETVARMLSQKVDARDDAMVLRKEPQPKTSRCC